MKDMTIEQIVWFEAWKAVASTVNCGVENVYKEAF